MLGRWQNPKMFRCIHSSDSDCGDKKSTFYSLSSSNVCRRSRSYRSITKCEEDHINLDDYFTPAEEIESECSICREQTCKPMPKITAKTYQPAYGHSTKTRKLFDRNVVRTQDRILGMKRHTNVYVRKFSPPREDIRRDFEKQIKFAKGNQTWSKTSSNGKGVQAEKITYCRPVAKHFNQEYKYKTLANKRKLQRLMKKPLISAREREKQKAAWDEYIYKLRIKHNKMIESQTTNSKSLVLPNTDIEIGAQEKHNTTGYRTVPSNHCKNLLHDLYNIQNTSSHLYTENPNKQNLYIGASNCTSQDLHFAYPCSSSGRLLKQGAKNSCDLGIYRKNTYSNINSNRTYADKNRQRIGATHADDSCCQRDKKLRYREKRVNKNIQNKLKSTYADNSNAPSSKNKLSHIKKIGLEPNSGENLLKNIEDKLNTLIEQMNSLINKSGSIKPHGFPFLTLLQPDISCPCKEQHIEQSETNEPNNNKESCCRTRMLKNKNEWLNKNDKECEANINACCKQIRNQFILETMVNKSTSTFEECCAIFKMNEILLEEMNKSDKAKRDIEGILNGESNSSSLQSIFDEPTRDFGTEVTKFEPDAKIVEDASFQSTELVTVYPNNQTQTLPMAVNHDPLGLLSLLRISSATIGRLINLIPFRYQSLLPQLIPRHVPRPHVIAFNCTVCDSSFQKSTEFSEHIIRVHKSEPSKDCCVCRHMVEKAVGQTNRSNLFRCQYCNQKFTRAYCCELHEQHCARRRGKKHDVPENLSFLS